MVSKYIVLIVSQIRSFRKNYNSHTKGVLTLKWNFVFIVMISILFLTVSCDTVTQPRVVNHSAPEPEVLNAYFNRPFITIEETLELYYGMSPSSVLSICGKPLYVALGSVDRTVWVYEVRELWVGEGVGNYQLTKFGTITEIMSQMHYLGLAFEYGTLATWAPVSPNQLFNSLIYGESLEITAEPLEE